jgi:hypothetical protein
MLLAEASRIIDQEKKEECLAIGANTMQGGHILIIPNVSGASRSWGNMITQLTHIEN